jgi:SAM-dependent methyltransferase
VLKTGHDLPDAEIRARYEALAGRGGLGPEFVRRVLALAPDLAGRRVLDVGCGQGELLRAIADRVDCALTGVDFAIRRLRGLDDLGAHARLVAHDLARPLPFADHAFDVAFCTETLEHLKRPDLALAEIRRVLAPGGRLVLSVPNATGFFPWNRVPRLVPGRWLRRRLLPYEHPGNTDQPIDTSFEYDEIVALVEGTGFQIEARTGWRYFRYLQMLPLVRPVYAAAYPAVERALERAGAQRFAYNLLLRCRPRIG